MKHPLFVRLACAAAIACISTVAAAQQYPSKPIRIIVPFAPGGTGDASIRNISDRLAERLKTSIVIENRGGAGGAVGTELVARAAPDGYTLLVGFDGTLAVSANVMKLRFDPLKDLAPITKLNDATLILAKHPSVPAKNFKELVEYSKKQPGGLNYGSSGHATTTHLAGELIAMQSGLKLTHIPYKGGGQSTADTIAGQIPLIFTLVPTVAPHLKSGRLEPIGIGSAKRLASLPNVPTLAEQGLTGFNVSSWFGLFAPANTPKHIIDILHRETVAVLALPEVQERYRGIGLEPIGNTPAEFHQQLAADLARWAKVVKDANIQILD